MARWTVEMQRIDNLPWHELTYTVHGDEIEDGLLGIIWLLQRQLDD